MNQVDEYFKKFNADMAKSKGKHSEATAKSYRSHITRFLAYLDGTPLEDVTPVLVEEYLHHLHVEENKCPGTINACLFALRSFLKYMTGTDEATAGVKRIGHKYKRRGHIPDEYLNVINDSALKGKTRDYLFYCVLRYFGLRITEAVRLTLNDVEMVRGRIALSVVGKGNKPRLLSMARERDHAFYACLASHLRGKGPGDPVFTTSNGQWSSDAARHAFKKLLTDAGLGEHGWTPHSLRHSFVTYKLSQGVSINVVSELAGHCNSRVTLEVYAHADQADMDKAMDI